MSQALWEVPPLLVPRPRRVALTGGRIECAPETAALDNQCDGGPVDRSTRNARQPCGWSVQRATWKGRPTQPGGYRLRIGPGDDEVVIEASDDAGVHHARATMRQIVRQYAPTVQSRGRWHVPCMVIEDWPAFASRGYMLDVSRCRVPKMEHLFEIIDLLAALKYNHLQLYTEHTFAYKGHREVWEDASPLTPTQVRELDEYCREVGIELAANQNCFGHLERWLRLPRYAPLAETHGEWGFEVPDGNGASRKVARRGPFSLCPTDPRSLELAEDLLGQLMPCCSSPLVNIGCDETFDVGQGRSAEAVRERGRAAVYFDHVNAVAEIARQHGKRAMLWADVALRHPEALDRMPDDAIALAWGYEPDTPWKEWLEVLRARRRTAQGSGAMWVCPGTSSWCSILGRTTERRANIAAAAREGVRGGATGFLLADWGDMGHRQQWPVSLNPIAQGAECAWNGGETDAGELEGRMADHLRAVSLHVFDDESLALAEWMDEMGDMDLPLRRVCGPRGPDGGPRPLRNASALFTDLHLPLTPRPDEDAAAREAVLSTSLDEWVDLGRRIASHRHKRPFDVRPLLRDRELDHAVAVAQMAMMRAVCRRSTKEPGTSWRMVARELRDVIQEHRALWHKRSRKGGLNASCRYYERILKELPR